MSERLRRRAEQIRQRALVRSWEYRQRHHSKGVWDRFRRLLVDAAEAWVIDDGDARRLAESSRAAQAVGAELAPPKRSRGKKWLGVSLKLMNQAARRRADSSPQTVTSS